MTTTIIDPSISDPSLDDEDGDEIAHLVKKEDATRAYITGEAIEALCGKLWVPSKDPEGKPVCSKCKEVLKMFNARNFN